MTFDADYKSPQTAEELSKDLEKHPERGKLNGKDVVRFEMKEFSGVIPYSLAIRALESGAPFGFTRDEILTAALTMWVSDPGIQQARKDYQQELADKHQTRTSLVRSKIRGAYKKVLRVKRLSDLESKD
ncbi:MAG TPA: hypothetical protein V6D14_10065 [Coleofasciculaceae cyanobacterium]